MPFNLPCTCGKTLLLKDEYAGQMVQCPSCNQVITAIRPEETGEATEMDVSVTATAPKSAPASSYEADNGERPRGTRRMDDDDDRPLRRRRRDDDDAYDPPLPPAPPIPGPNNTTPNASIGVGVLMMIGAVVWFVGGLFLDRIFFYPPILFILGIITVFRGATQRQ